jgi:hypothetical protein
MRAAPAASAGPDAPQALRRVHMDVLYSASLLHAAGKNEALRAIRLWVETVVRQRGCLMDCSVSIAEDLPELKRRVQGGPVSLVPPVDPEDLERVRTLYTKYRPISGKTAAAQTAVPGGVRLGVRP